MGEDVGGPLVLLSPPREGFLSLLGKRRFSKMGNVVGSDSSAGSALFPSGSGMSLDSLPSSWDS